MEISLLIARMLRCDQGCHVYQHLIKPRFYLIPSDGGVALFTLAIFPMVLYWV